MKIHEYDEMMRYLTRPADKLSRADKKAVVGDFHKRNNEFWEKQNHLKKPESVARMINVLRKI